MQHSSQAFDKVKHKQRHGCVQLHAAKVTSVRISLTATEVPCIDYLCPCAVAHSQNNPLAATQLQQCSDCLVAPCAFQAVTLITHQHCSKGGAGKRVSTGLLQQSIFPQQKLLGRTAACVTCMSMHHISIIQLPASTAVPATLIQIKVAEALGHLCYYIIMSGLTPAHHHSSP